MLWLKIGTLVITALPKLISLIERLKGDPGQGATKKQAVKDLILAMVETTEGAAGKDLLNDPEVSRAYDAVNDAIVAFQNLLVKKSAPTP